MKNISVLSTVEAMERISSLNEEYAVMFITDNKQAFKYFFDGKELTEELEEYADMTELRDYLNDDDNCVDIISFEDKNGYDYKYWQADEIIRFCQRQSDIDNVL